jgi:hypothetical protein
MRASSGIATTTKAGVTAFSMREAGFNRTNSPFSLAGLARMARISVHPDGCHVVDESNTHSQAFGGHHTRLLALNTDSRDDNKRRRRC